MIGTRRLCAIPGALSLPAAETMEFQIEKNSPVPAIRQIQEQIKLSIAMGVLKRGDLLPPIREVEKQTGVNRGQIHRAYLALQRSGLLSPAACKRTAVAVSAAAPDSVNKKCRELTNEIVRRVGRIGISPVSFVRYLSRSVQEEERRSPYVAYVDPDKESALRRADQIARLWQTSVAGLSLDEIRNAPALRNRLRKILVNHLAADSVRRALRGRRADIIPVEIRYSEQTIQALKRVRASAVLLLLPIHAVSSARFIVDQLRRWMAGKSLKISWMLVDDVADFESLLGDTRFDRILVSPGARQKVPAPLRRNAHWILLQMELDPEALETARVRAGVIV